jgi:hypothetical protein
LYKGIKEIKIHMKLRAPISTALMSDIRTLAHRRMRVDLRVKSKDAKQAIAMHDVRKN